MSVDSSFIRERLKTLEKLFCLYDLSHISAVKEEILCVHHLLLKNRWVRCSAGHSRVCLVKWNLHHLQAFTTVSKMILGVTTKMYARWKVCNIYWEIVQTKHEKKKLCNCRHLDLFHLYSLSVFVPAVTITIVALSVACSPIGSIY